VPKFATEHDHEPVLSTTHSHALFLYASSERYYSISLFVIKISVQTACVSVWSSILHTQFFRLSQWLQAAS